jgi:alkylation response protein AidB-like acyl-CoA dehydrogenase
VSALLSAIAAQADTAERERKVSREIIKGLAEAGAIHTLVPRALGGGELHPRAFLEIVEQISRVDASTGWVVMIGATSAINAAYLEESAARAVFGDGPGAFTAGIFAPRNAATASDGGYRLSGRWSFGSGCEHASWIALNSLVEDETGTRLMFLQVPASDFQVIDTWDVSGLRATGSHDVEVNDVFVPDDYGYAVGIDRPRHDGLLYQFSVMGLLSVAVAAVALGVARGAIDDIRELATAKTPTGRRRALADWNVAQVDFAQAEAAVRSGRAFLIEAIDEMWDALERGDSPSPEQKALVRLGATAATQGSVRAVDTAYNLGGGTSIYATSTLQRRFRDIHTLTQHIMIGQSSLEAAGRTLLGLNVPPGFL